MTTKPRKRRTPKVPAALFSVLGDLPVSFSKKLVKKRNAIGLVEFRPRAVTLQDGMSDVATWQTLAHEMTHVALWDGGVHNILSAEQQEAICDALGTYIAAAVLAGRITFK